jgi:hypothetical protein
MSPATGDPFESTTTTWASPLEQLLATSDQSGISLEPMNSAGSLEDSTSAPSTVFGEAADPSVTPQVYTEFQDSSGADVTGFTQELAPIQMTSADDSLPTIASVDTMFDTTSAAGVHSELWSATHQHDSTALFPEQANDHEAITSFDAGGYTDPFAIS